MSVRFFNALAINGLDGWLMSWNLLDEPHRSAAHPQDRQHNAGPLPPVEPNPPHDEKLASRIRAGDLVLFILRLGLSEAMALFN